MSEEDDGVITRLARMVRGNEHRRNDAQTDSLGCLSGGVRHLFPKKKVPGIITTQGLATNN